METQKMKTQKTQKRPAAEYEQNNSLNKKKKNTETDTPKSVNMTKGQLEKKNKIRSENKMEEYKRLSHNQY